MDASAEKGADRQHHRAGHETQPHLGLDADHAVLLDDEVVDGLLEEEESGLILDRHAHGGLVEQAIGLGAGGAHRRPLAGVEDAELDAAPIGGAGHEPAERVDLLDQVPLADAADRRVAAHLADGLDVLGQQQGARAAARRRQRRLGARRDRRRPPPHRIDRSQTCRQSAPTEARQFNPNQRDEND